MSLQMLGIVVSLVGYSLLIYAFGYNEGKKEDRRSYLAGINLVFTYLSEHRIKLVENEAGARDHPDEEQEQ